MTVITAGILLLFGLPQGNEAVYPDTVRVGARTIELHEDRLMTEYRAFSASHDEVACAGSSIIVSYDYDAACKAPIPDEVRALILELDGARLNS